LHRVQQAAIDIIRSYVCLTVMLCIVAKQYILQQKCPPRNMKVQNLNHLQLHRSWAPKLPNISCQHCKLLIYCMMLILLNIQ